MILARLLGSVLGQSRRALPAGRPRLLLEQGEASLKHGDVGAAANAFEDARKLAPRNAPLRYRIAMAYIGAGLHADAQGHLERCIALDPHYPEAYTRLGNVHYLNRDLARADQLYRHALELDSGDAVAHYNLALLLRSQRLQREALSHFRAAHAVGSLRGDMLRSLVSALIVCDEYDEAWDVAAEAWATEPAAYESWFCLGLAHQKQHRYADALACYDKALGVSSGDAELFAHRAATLQELGRLPEAFQGYDLALALQPDDALARFHRSLASLLVGNYGSAWLDYESRLLSEDLPVRPRSYPRWDASAAVGHRILIYGEQGLGDEIMFASCIPDLMRSGARCVIECDPRLRGLFAFSFPEATVYAATADRRVPDAIDAQGIDFEVPLGSLPLHYRTSSADFPHHDGYLKVAPERVAAWRARLDALGSGPKVGISWRGGTYKSRSPLRSVELDRWLPIFHIPGIRFVSLQYTPDAPSELAALSRDHGVQVTHWPQAIADYEDTAALVSALDLTITVCTSIVHLAGALGRPVWVMAPHNPEWRYGKSGEGLPWYPSARMFRQRVYGQWQEVIESVATQLADGIRR